MTRLARVQTDRHLMDTYQTHADRALNLFRRQMATLSDYRRPRRNSFTAIRQTNIARQQVVALHTGTELDLGLTPITSHGLPMNPVFAPKPKRPYTLTDPGRRSLQASIRTHNLG